MQKEKVYEGPSILHDDTVENEQVCADLCLKTDACKLWTFFGASSGNKKGCWLRELASSLGADSDAVSGNHVCGNSK